MEYKNAQLPNNEFEIEQIEIEYRIKLVNYWINIKAIEGVQTLQGGCEIEKFKEVDKWLHPV